MNMKKILLVMIGLLLSGFGNVWAGGHFDVYVGPVWGPRYYPSHRYYPSPYYFPPPIYYPPQVIVVPPPEPQVYIEQAEVPPEPATPAQQYWYYCASAKGYYPYIKECPGGWQKVLPVPAGK